MTSLDMILEKTKRISDLENELAKMAKYKVLEGFWVSDSPYGDAMVWTNTGNPHGPSPVLAQYDTPAPLWEALSGLLSHEPPELPR